MASQSEQDAYKNQEVLRVVGGMPMLLNLIFAWMQWWWKGEMNTFPRIIQLALSIV